MFGYVVCMPARLVPRLFIDELSHPQLKAINIGASITPYALRK